MWFNLIRHRESGDLKKANNRMTTATAYTSTALGSAITASPSSAGTPTTEFVDCTTVGRIAITTRTETAADGTTVTLTHEHVLDSGEHFYGIDIAGTEESITLTGAQYAALAKLTGATE